MEPHAVGPVLLKRTAWLTLNGTETDGSKSTVHWTRQKQISGLAFRVIFHRFHRLTVISVSFCKLDKGDYPQKLAGCVLS